MMAQRILVVEDDPKIAAFLVQGLREDAFEVDYAADGVDAITRARANSYALILLDYMLPRKNGIDVVSELRQAGSRVPILMLTARDTPEDRRRMETAGVDALLGKPFRFDELLRRMRELMGSA